MEKSRNLNEEKIVISNLLYYNQIIKKEDKAMENQNIEVDVIISDNTDYQDEIQRAIAEFNMQKHPKHEIFKVYREEGYNNPIGFYALLENKMVGGIIARKKMQWLDIDILFVNQNYRNHKIGSHLMSKAIEYCKKENLIGIHLYTLDFQARGFYEKQGFKLIAEIEDWPKGITRYEFIKYI